MPESSSATGGSAREAQSALLREALLARADAEAAQVRADAAREESERAREEAERARALAERAKEESERARREAELGRSRLAVLTEAGQRMAESIDWETTLQAVVRSPVPAVADWTALTMLEPDGGLRVVAIAHRDPERERLAWQLIERHPPDLQDRTGAAQVIRSGELELVEDVSTEAIGALAEDSEHLRLLENLNVRHFVTAPLRAPGGVIGALSFVLGDSGRRFGLEDRQLITSMAARAALHIQNSRLYTERSHIAEVLQAGLRPGALPEIPGAELAARFTPAGDQIEVGGDFYDVFPSGEKSWTAIIGDVSGKGAEAAAVTALARHTLRTAALLHEDPGANLALLNRALIADNSETRFCTVFYIRLCPEGGAIDCRFANGGHPPPLVLRASGAVDTIDSGHGPLVGGFPEAGYVEGTLRLEAGDLLLMYTDGVTEIRRSDVPLGEATLRRTLAASAGRSAEAVLSAVHSRAVELSEGSPRDDIALLAIKVLATESGGAPSDG